MDTMYQRSKIQDESLYYESRNHDGSLPLVGVNTFLPPPGQEETIEERELMRSSEEEKRQQIDNLAAFQARHGAETPEALAQLQRVAEQRGNLFAERLMTVAHTARKQNKNVLAFLTSCCTAALDREPPASLFAHAT